MCYAPADIPEVEVPFVTRYKGYESDEKLSKRWMDIHEERRLDIFGRESPKMDLIEPVFWDKQACDQKSGMN